MLIFFMFTVFHVIFCALKLQLSLPGVLPLALGSEGSAAVNWFQAQFAGRLVEKESGIVGFLNLLNDGCLMVVSWDASKRLHFQRGLLGYWEGQLYNMKF